MKNYFLSGVAATALLGLSTMAMADEQDARVRELNNQALQQAQQQTQQAAQPALPASPADMKDETDDTAAAPMPADEKMAAAPGQNTMNPTPAQRGPTDSNAVAVSDVKNPKQTLANASIETKEGQKVGEVTSVVTDPSGKASAVMMTAQGDQTVRVDAKTLTFFPDRGVLVTELSATDINPAAPPASSTPPPTDAQLPSDVTPSTAVPTNIEPKS